MKLRLLVIATLLATGAVQAADQAPPAAAPAPAPAADKPAATPAPAQPSGSVARSQLTSAIQNNEPIDKLTTLSNDQTRIYFFTDVRNLGGQKITHRWEHKGKVMSEIPLNVGGSPWRTYSSKTLDPSWTGEWKVTAVDDAGNTLSATTFTYSGKEAAPAATPAAPAPAAPAAKP
ncbi:MAG: DUF2914 domain-containing protein [Pseudomonadota bacterium]